MNFTKEEIEKSIENLGKAIKALKELWLEEVNQTRRDIYQERYEESLKRKKELEEMLK